jgi:hypothetical protein
MEEDDMSGYVIHVGRRQMHAGLYWSFGRPSLRWKVKNKIKIVANEIVREGVHWINLARMGKNG